MHAYTKVLSGRQKFVTIFNVFSVRLINVNDPPVITVNGGTSTTVTYREGDGLTDVGKGIAVSDGDDVNLDGYFIDRIRRELV